jgi:ATP-dependent exoDNAse (exonuclease V) alpha subunit
MGYVAVSRAREDAIIYTNSIEELRSALDRRVDKETALEAMRETAEHRHELKDDQSPYDVENRKSFEKVQDYEADMTDELNNDRAEEAIETEEMEFSLL